MKLPSYLWRKRQQLFAATALVALCFPVGAAETPLPKVTGPLSVTTTSFPQLAANRTQTPIDLAKLGYIEEEFIVSGAANVYRWLPDGRLEIKTAGAPYATRILVRRPANPLRFSGTVIVELLNEARGYDWSFIWALSYGHFTERGDAFVGITHVPENVDALKKFDATRYAALSFANPNPAESCGARSATAAPAAPAALAALAEEGLRWDMASQIGALLKSKSASGPMAGLNVEKLYLTSHHGHAVTYAIAIHSRANLANGKPVYDGFLIKSSDNPVRLSRCDAAPQNGDPRQIVKNVSVPVIRVVPQGELLRPNTFRRPDSDEPSDRFRLYEVPGAPRMDKIYFEHLPLVEDQIQSGQPATRSQWPFDYRCVPEVELVDYPAMRYAVNAAFDHLDRWVRTGAPPPRAERIAVNGFGATGAIFDNDAFGNAKGGVRNPFLDVPRATYAANGPGQCASIMTKTPFESSRLQELYPTSRSYADKVTSAIDRLVKEEWLTTSDAAQVKAAK